jgi:hypothetical protein
MDEEKRIEALKKLREPFPDNLISALPKPTKSQTDAVKADFKTGVRCDICAGWHHPSVAHLSYVGHAALTDRLLSVDPFWDWSPLAFDAAGLPVLDSNGGLWIKLTVCGMTRLGYGDAPGKLGGDAMKERIGDALRNAGIRFGAALDLWHKGDLHAHESAEKQEDEKPAPQKQAITDDRLTTAIAKIKSGEYSRAALLKTFVLTEAQLQWLDDEAA